MRDITFSFSLRGFPSLKDANRAERFYAWSHEEIPATLGPKDGEFFVHVYGAKEDGNFRGHGHGQGTD
jgi:uncharacterized protein YyaL (SSP411 family)